MKTNLSARRTRRMRLILASAAIVSLFLLEVGLGESLLSGAARFVKADPHHQPASNWTVSDLVALGS